MGLPQELFYETEDLYDVKCTICLLTCDVPRRISSCQHHHFCRSCIRQWLRDHDTCPNCNAAGEVAPPTTEFSEKMANIPTKCTNYDFGCRTHIPYSQQAAHVQTCEHRLTQCPRRCGTIFSLNAMPIHLLTCDSAIDPLLESLMCFRCAFVYTHGGTPLHCNYFELARRVWEHPIGQDFAYDTQRIPRPTVTEDATHGGRTHNNQ